MESTLTGKGANSFLFEVTPFYKGCINENGRVVSPESVSIHLEKTGDLK